MAEQSAQQEPSMEEILASIRRIISEDAEEEAPGGAPEAAAGPTEVPPEPEPEPDPEPEPAPEELDEPQAEQEDSMEPVQVEPEPEALAPEPDVDAPPPDPEPEPVPEPDPVPVMEAVADDPALPDPIDDTDDVLELTEVAPGTPGGEPIVSHMTEAATSEHLQALSGLLVRSYPGRKIPLRVWCGKCSNPCCANGWMPIFQNWLKTWSIARLRGLQGATNKSQYLNSFRPAFSFLMRHANTGGAVALRDVGYV